MKTKREIIDETVAYYSDPSKRAYFDWKCSYWKDGKMCAVGRCLINPKNIQDIVEETCFCISGSVRSLSKKIDFQSALKEEYRGHEIEFWTWLQNFHDEASHFDKDTISESGLAYIKTMKDKWCEEADCN